MNEDDDLESPECLKARIAHLESILASERSERKLERWFQRGARAYFKGYGMMVKGGLTMLAAVMADEEL